MRTTLLNTHEPEHITSRTRTYTSALSGGLAFAVVGAITRKFSPPALRPCRSNDEKAEERM